MELTGVRRHRGDSAGIEKRSVGVPAEQGSTIVDALIANGVRHPDRPAMRHCSAERPTEWEVLTWADYLLAARQIAGGLAELGVGPGQRVAILSANRVEWHLADLGALLNGSVTVPVYPTSSPSQVAYILGHAEVKVCFVDSHAQLGKLTEIRDQLPALERVVLADGAWRSGDSFVIGFEEFRAWGADRLTRDPDAIEERSRQVQPDDLATIVYTSGTTGPPKGTMISHANIMWTLRKVTPVYNIGEGDRLLSFLPLSHIAERMMSDFLPIGVGGETWFARSLATVAEDLPACRPTVFLAVPRVWEKLREGIEGHIRTQASPVRAALEHYISLGLRSVTAEQDGTPLHRSAVAVYRSLDATLGATIRQTLGLDRAKVLVTAAAPTHPDLIRWFHAIGLPLLQIYGQTEGCGPTTATRPDHNRIGTVGTALPGMRVRIADDEEVLLKGGNVCLGYLNDPEATAELIDEEGWMHTGDTGAFDSDGSLRIIGRKKDLIITAAGKNIAPQGIEIDLQNQPLISEAIVVGEGRRYLAALVTLDPEELTRWAQERNKLGDLEALAADPDLLAEIQAAIDEVNAKRSHAESIRKFRVLAHVLTAEDGELTPTMKVKRAVVYDHHREVIEEIYAGS
ncbi:MAG TPA: long-chain fatty acid--CoA ligase [Acidimicrobiales bacterium]|nr:long-chain fatty acid--CoA ligase [Acidimicrobiales bacterium]